MKRNANKKLSPFTFVDGQPNLTELLKNFKDRDFVVLQKGDGNVKKKGYTWVQAFKYLNRFGGGLNANTRLVTKLMEQGECDTLIVLFDRVHDSSTNEVLYNRTVAVIPHIYLDAAPNFMTGPIGGRQLAPKYGGALFRELVTHVGEEGRIVSMYNFLSGLNREFMQSGAQLADEALRYTVIEQLSHMLKVPFRKLTFLNNHITEYDPFWVQKMREEEEGLKATVQVPQSAGLDTSALSDRFRFHSDPKRSKSGQKKTINTSLLRPSARIFQLKHTVTKPDGTTKETSLTAGSRSSWAENTLEQDTTPRDEPEIEDTFTIEGIADDQDQNLLIGEEQSEASSSDNDGDT